LKLKALGIKKFLKKYSFISPKVKCIKITGERGWILPKIFQPCSEIKSVRNKKVLKKIFRRIPQK